MAMPNGAGTDLSSSSSTLVELLDQVDRALAATVEPATSAEGISREGWRVLLLLAKRIPSGASGLSMGEIAEQAELAAPTATRVVDRLVADKLAERRGDPEDRRRVLVHLAPRGREVLRRVSGRLETSSRAGLADLLSALAGAVPREG